MDHIVLDIEIQRLPGQDGLTWEDTDKLGVSCAVVYEFASDRYRVYGPGDVQALRQRILEAERVTGWNSWKFDLPVIWGCCKSGWPPFSVALADLSRSFSGKDFLARQNDLLRRIWQAQGLDADVFRGKTHGGWGLDAVARGTLGQGKSGHGQEAPSWFQEGNWARLLTYCLDDVRLTRDLSAFVDCYGFLRNQDGRCVQLPKWDGEEAA
jgi:hypothetical protein